MKRTIEGLSKEQQDELDAMLQKHTQEYSDFLQKYNIKEPILEDLGQGVSLNFTPFDIDIPSIEKVNPTEENDLTGEANISEYQDENELATNNKLAAILKEYRSYYHNLSKDEQEELNEEFEHTENIIKHIRNIFIDRPDIVILLSDLSDQEQEELFEAVYSTRSIETRSKASLSPDIIAARKEFFKLPLQLQTVPPTFIDKKGEILAIEAYFDIGNKKYRTQRADLITGHRQMRHVIPVAFTAKIASSIIKIDDKQMRKNSLAQALEIFGSFEQHGYMMTDQEYEHASPSFSSTLFNKINELALQAKKMSTDILIPSKIFNELNQDKKIDVNLDIQHQHLQAYKRIAKEYTIRSIYEILQADNINSYILENILQGALTTAFSQHTDVSFPTEGHTTEYEIKIDENGETIVISLQELKEMIEGKDKELSKVRIVKSEGANVRNAVRTIDDLTQKLVDLYNVNQKTNSVNLGDYKRQRIKIVDQITHQMYKVFDYKKLEEEIIVPAENKKPDKNIFKIGNKYYQIVEGKIYRENQRKTARSEYLSNIQFREEETLSNQEKQISKLTDLVDKYIEVVMLAFPDIQITNEIEKEFVESFIKRVEEDYQISGRILENIKARRKESTYDTYEESHDTSIYQQDIDDPKEGSINISLDDGSKKILESIKEKMNIQSEKIRDNENIGNITIVSPQKKRFRQ